MPKHLTIDQYLADLSANGVDLTNQLRILLKKALPGITETVDSWGHLAFSLDGKPIAWMINYTNHVNFGFTFGARLHSGRLEGTGKNFRHIKIKSAADIDEREFTRLLHEAAKLKIE